MMPERLLGAIAVVIGDFFTNLDGVLRDEDKSGYLVDVDHACDEIAIP